ncbi:MAG: methyltransferase domain-containing protein [Candidimonas sp.]|nr:MAG: methyltransferase domain-containing protein [Candidimonas sp.]
MSSGACTVSVEQEHWNCPAPIEDLSGWLERHWEPFDPAHAQALLWPERPARSSLSILVAGCGPNQAAVLARTNPAARVVATDMSGPSLTHEQHLKEKYGLTNLKLRQMPIEEVGSLGETFDLLICTSVLSHLMDARPAVRALAGSTRPDGVIALRLPAHYARAGIVRLQSVFTRMGLKRDAASIALARSVLEAVATDHPVRSHPAFAKDLTDAALADLFLHARTPDYTVSDCLSLAEGAGLEFQGWLCRAPYYPHDFFSGGTAGDQAIRRLPERTVWAIMEALDVANACHRFLVTPRMRPAAAYTVDFSGDGWPGYVPGLRRGCQLEGARLSRPGLSLDLRKSRALLMGRVDGKRSIAEIVSDVGAPSGQSVAAFFDALWKLDFLSIAKVPAR